jgi:membrane protein required for colicin V production
MCLGALAGWIISYLMRRAVGLSTIDRLLGLLFGVTRGAVMLGFAAMLGETLKLQSEPWWMHSKLAPYAVDVGHWLSHVAGNSREFVRAALPEAPTGDRS